MLFLCSYAYLTYKSPEEATQVTEKYRDIEMDGNKLLVVHYGTYYVDKPKRREYLGIDCEINLLILHFLLILPMQCYTF